VQQQTSHFRLLQTALVVITHLFLNKDDMDAKEILTIHQDLSFIISTFKQVSTMEAGRFFHVQGEKLEVLLTKAAQISQKSRRSAAHTEDPSLRAPQIQSVSIQRSMPSTGLHDEGDNHHHPQSSKPLDFEQCLLELSHGWPAATAAVSQEEQEDNQIWRDFLSMLDSDTLPL
jgi:hypothetical protein